jgi:transposase-like protein
MCHQEAYKRFPTGEFETLTLVAQGPNGLPDPNGNLIEKVGANGIPVVDPITQDFLFEPADAESQLPVPLMISRHEAARTVHATTRKSCLNCHAGAGGGDGTKRGDISSVLVDPTPDIDIHMSSAGGDMSCSDCHDAGGHRVKGRGLDLRPNDVDERFTCEGCHEQPHGDFSNTTGSSLDKHASRVACETCHIPTYAKGMPTEVSRDWLNPHFSAAACNGRGGWLPEEVKQSDLIPSYSWFDGTSKVYVLGESLDDYLPTKTLADGSQAFTIGKPNGAVDSVGAKLYPMKEHLSKLAVNDSTNQLIAHSTFEFFRTGDFDAAVQSALQQTGREGDSYHVVQVHTFQTISHGVEATGAALECGECHSDSRLSGGPLRMNLPADLGYELKGTLREVCSQCHGYENYEGFVRNHDRHVRDKRYDCSNCHKFSRPERGLRTR